MNSDPRLHPPRAALHPQAALVHPWPFKPCALGFFLIRSTQQGSTCTCPNTYVSTLLPCLPTATRTAGQEEKEKEKERCMEVGGFENACRKAGRWWMRPATVTDMTHLHVVAIVLPCQLEDKTSQDAYRCYISKFAEFRLCCMFKATH